MKIVKRSDRNFQRELRVVLNREGGKQAEVEGTVKEIVEAVRQGGDRQVAEFARRFEGTDLAPGELILPGRRIKKEKIPSPTLDLIERAIARIRNYHEKQREKSWFDQDGEGNILGQVVRPLERVGVYVPGGKAFYPSSLLMNVIPAQVAGVSQIVVCSPPGGDGQYQPLLLAAAEMLGIDTFYRTGGAQAIAAMAYGTETLPPVDKIVGPGNIYVATAKRMVYGTVGIDMIAGPSEILVLADQSANPEYVAADLLSQAEHDQLASAVLVTPSPELAEQVKRQVNEQLKILSRADLCSESLENNGRILVTGSWEEALELSNDIAPEHLVICSGQPFETLGKIRNAGAIFLGNSTPQSIGDYWAGPNHVLPTNRTARFSSPLGTRDFLKRSSVVYYSEKGIKSQGKDASRFAVLEGLEAHSRAIEKRLAE
ncbi:MAG: histidinol dehydrogenase [bacterium]